jgi:hypothetical protein
MPRQKSDYEIGYGKPPKHTQYAKGQSGNRNGRPKGSFNLVARFMKIINERIKVTKNGRPCSMAKFDATITQMVNKAASGDMRATRELHNWFDSLPIEQFTMGPPPDIHVHFISAKNKMHEQKELPEVNSDIPKRSSWEESLEGQIENSGSSNGAVQPPNGASNSERKRE